jgi:hypothetical protein
VSQIANFSTFRARFNAYADDLLMVQAARFAHDGMPDLRRPVRAGPRLLGRGLEKNLSGI